MVSRMKNKRVNCIICGARSKVTYERFCSSKCIEKHMEYIIIDIPKPFIFRLFLHCKDHSHRVVQLEEYANRHGYNKELTIKKAKEIYMEKIKAKND